MSKSLIIKVFLTKEISVSVYTEIGTACAA